MGWYLVITEEMRAAGLTGNALLIFALIYGYSQGEQGCYYGSLAHTSEVVGCTRQTAISILKDLLDAGLVERFEFMDNGLHRVAYRTGKNFCNSQIILPDQSKNLTDAGQKILPNNKGDNKSISKLGIYSAPARGFNPPTIDEVAAYCRERGNTIDPQQFIDYYAANGWMVGKSRMHDWRAAVRTWEARRRNDPTPNPRPYRQREYESPEAHNLRILRQMQERDGNLHTFNPDEQ